MALPGLLTGAYAAIGDWGLRFLHVEFYSEVWATIPYAIFFGIALLVFALGQSLVTEWILGIHHSPRGTNRLASSSLCQANEMYIRYPPDVQLCSKTELTYNRKG